MALSDRFKENNEGFAPDSFEALLLSLEKEVPQTGGNQQEPTPIDKTNQQTESEEVSKNEKDTTEPEESETQPETETQPTEKTEETEEEKSEKQPENSENELFTTIKEYSPELETVDDAKQYIVELHNQLKQSEEVVEKFVNILEANPLLINLIQNLNNGVPFYESVRQVIGLKEDEEIPDPTKDLNAYNEYVKRMMKREAELEKKKKEIENEEKMRTELEQKAKRVRQEFKKKMNLDDKEMQKFIEFIDDFLYGDITKDNPQSLLDKMWILYKYPEEIKNIEEKAKIQGKNEAIKDIKSKTNKTDNIPRIESSPKPKEVKDELDDLIKVTKSESRIFY